MDTGYKAGNDLVDLTDPCAMDRHRDDRFMKRAFTEKERMAIAADADPHRRLWSHWAAKETAFKIMVKFIPYAGSWPKCYETSLWKPSSGQADLEGTVTSSWGRTHVAVFFMEDRLHCIGTSGQIDDLHKIIHGECRLTSPGLAKVTASETARFLIVRNLSLCLGIAAERIRIVRHHGKRGLLHPMLLIDGKTSGIDISISHDGNFTGYAITGIHC